ncbi:MerR family transcriptional regulator [Rugosimonospora africana]|uniref:Transcriptional regulator n=1 Tax=Rugosimonospora africana TaxID=556532 RepID=A0A8J3QQ30_9ACTN|nr:MerR family transcriptional regulator [Rugosimonospora africana]GIH13388.1 transcriptional regulator [Rugosimonospora africana]
MTVDDLSAGEVARQLGIAVTTLRTWHQRYGLGPTGHVPGQHRRYTADDLTLLSRMRELITRGVPPARAAQKALGAREPDTPARDGGGRAIGVGRSHPAARGLSRAALRLDAAAVAGLLNEQLTATGVVRAWEDVVVPVLRGIGARHASTGAMVEVEHLLSACVSAALAGIPRPEPSGPPRVLLGCADEEMHSLPIEALAAGLAEAGLAVRQLGARVPPRALRDAARRTGPAAVGLWAHAARYAVPAQLLDLAELPDPPTLLLAVGPGWDEVRLPPSVSRPRTLSEAVAILTAGSY